MFKFKTIFVIGSTITFLLLIIFVLIFYNNPFSKPKVKFDLSRDSVVKQVQKLGSLETASFTIEKIVEAGQQGNAFQNLLYGDRILLIAQGKVVAGIDLYKIADNDITIQDKELSINLPPPKILSSTLDNSKTRVYDRTQGFLNRGNKDLETQVRQAAETSITKAACDEGILEEARTNAIERIKQLFKFAGFSSVKVNIGAGKC